MFEIKPLAGQSLELFHLYRTASQILDGSLEDPSTNQPAHSMAMVTPAEGFLDNPETFVQQNVSDATQASTASALRSLAAGMQGLQTPHERRCALAIVSQAVQQRVAESMLGFAPAAATPSAPFELPGIMSSQS